MPGLVSEERPRDRWGREGLMPRPPLRRKAVMTQRPRLAETGRAFRGGHERCGGREGSVATRVSLRASADLCALGSPAAKGAAPSCLRTPAVTPACRCSLSALGRLQPGLKAWLRARQSPVWCGVPLLGGSREPCVRSSTETKPFQPAGSVTQKRPFRGTQLPGERR